MQNEMAEGCRKAVPRFSKEKFVENWTEVLNAEPQPNGVLGKTISPVVSEVRAAGSNILEFVPNCSFSTDQGMLLVKREQVEVVFAAMCQAGTWALP